MSDGAAQQGDEADEASASDGASQLIPGVRRTTGRDRISQNGLTMRFTALSLLALALTVTPPVADAHECGPVDGPDWQPRRGATWTYSAGFGGTPGVFASGGVILGKVPARCNRCAFGAVSSGVLIQASAGQYSGRFSLGYESRNPMNGYGLQVTLEHAWRDKGSTPAGVSYAGPEVILALAPAVVTTGVLWRVSGNGGAGARWTWQLALGF